VASDSWSGPLAEPERWQVSTDAAEVYESRFVPAIFGAWAGPVADVAARTEPEIAWRRGDAASLPFEEATFDVVVSQFALMYFPDRVASLREMWRTLAPGGRLSVAAWRRSITPAATRSWWISPSDNAGVRQQTCWQHRSS
jgi:SAM-dependent methyltransferase